MCVNVKGRAPVVHPSVFRQTARPIDLNDIVGVVLQVKHMNFLAHARGVGLMLSVHPNRQEALSGDSHLVAASKYRRVTLQVSHLIFFFSLTGLMVFS